jgi:hypothetical protein
MIFLLPEYLKLFLFLPLILPFWLFYFFNKRSTRKGLGTGAPLRKISHLHSLWRDPAQACRDAAGSNRQNRCKASASNLPGGSRTSR